MIYTVLVGTLVYRSLGWKEFWGAARKSARTTAMVLFIIATATAQVPHTLGYAGHLENDAGPVNGSVDIGVSVYQSAREGTPLWTE